jgi:membrane-associated phospholipid phosphatase
VKALKTGTLTIVRLLEFPHAWGILIGLIALDAIWKLNTSLAPPLFSQVIFLPLFAFIFVKFLFGEIMRPGSGITAPEWVKDCSKKFFSGTEFFFLFLCAGFSFAYLSYLMCTLNFPLVDQQLDQIDKLMGFYWLPWYEWAKDKLILNAMYHCLGYEMIFFVAYFSIFLNKARLYEIFWLLFIALIITVPISGIFPAYGPLYLYNLIGHFDVLDPEIYNSFVDVNLIRGGKSPDLLHGFKGIITFPSFHTTCAICYAYAFRGQGVVGYSMLWLNLLMLASTPFFGGHYLIDVLAGSLVALISILIVRAQTLKRKCITSPSLTI